MANESVERFKRRLARLPQTAKDQAFVGLVEQANRMAGLMRRAAPAKSGRLRESIRVEPGRHELSVAIKAGGPKTTVPARNGQGSYDYALAVEFGTQPHEAGGLYEGADHPGSTARPFFWPSYRLVKRQVRSAIGRRVKKAVKEHFDRA